MRTFRVISGFACVVLLVAAALKLEQLPMAGLPGGGPGPALSLVLITGETGFAAALVLWTWPGRWRWAPGLCFAVFACVATTKAFNDAASCGCFGRVTINPWWTAGLDVMLAAGLWVWPPRGDAAALTGRRWTVWPRAGVVVGASVVALALGLWRLPTTQAASAGGEPVRGEPAGVEPAGLRRVGGVTLLEPAAWVGRRFPLLGDIDVGRALGRGRWLVVLHRADCDTCHDALPGYAAQAGQGRSVALIELPPHRRERTDSGEGLVHGELTAAREWFAGTPVVAMLHDGVVLDAAEGASAVGLTADWVQGRLVTATR